MIEIIEKKDCCGCGACAQVCPKRCIKLEEDSQGFSYPSINIKSCINCGLCEKVCPYLNQDPPRIPIKVYAAINNNESVRMKSSSGGIFSMIAEDIINNGGVVFGARFNEDHELIHDFSETIDGVRYFRGSKYLQSRINDTYIQARAFLKIGRTVLFSGTPCQIAGLKKFLRKNYENLVTIEIVCHGVPSPLVWRDYLKNIRGNHEIGFVSTKLKIDSWRRYFYCITDNSNNYLVCESSSKNIYHQAYLKNFSIRPSCFNCPAKAGKSNSDITLGDCWGIDKMMPSIDDDKGVSYVSCGTQKGLEVVNKTVATRYEVPYEDCIRFNSCIINSTKMPSHYMDFWHKYQLDGLKTLNNFFTKPSILQRIMKFINKI